MNTLRFLSDVKIHTCISIQGLGELKSFYFLLRVREDFLRHQKDYQVVYNHAVIDTFSRKSLVHIFIFLKGSVISLVYIKVALGNKTKMGSLVNRIFGQKFTRNAKNFCFACKCNFCNFYHSNFVALKIGSKVKISPYIQPSNFYSALC